MKVWDVCEEHNSRHMPNESECERGALSYLWLGIPPTPCRMVEMRLVSVDALVVDRLRPSTSDLIAELVERGVLIGDDYEEAK